MENADVITLQEADIISCLFGETPHADFSNTDKQQVKALIEEYRDIWKQRGYEILEIKRKVPVSKIINAEANEADGWLQHTHIIYNTKTMLPNKLDNNQAKEIEPLFAKRCVNKNKQPYSNYRGVGQEFRIMIDGKYSSESKRFFVFSMHLDYNTDNRNALASLLQ